MLHFLILKSKKDGFIPHINSSDIQTMNNLIPGEEFVLKKFTDNVFGITVYVWIIKNHFFKPEYYFYENKNSLVIFNGWTNYGNNSLSNDASNLPVKKILNNTVNSGEFFLFYYDKIKKTASIKRSLNGSIQTYHGSNDKLDVFSSRASLAAYAIHGKNCIDNHKDIIDKNFIAEIISTSWALSSKSLFKNVSIINHGVDIFLTKNSVKFNNIDNPWHDLEYLELYNKDKKRFWDTSYESIISNLNLILNTFNSNFSFPLSGGKDSRLLLALIKKASKNNHIESVYTNGPLYSGEYISAHNVAKYMNIEHFNNESGYFGLTVHDKILKHIFLTEGEVSPMDLSFNYLRKNNKIVLRGQESGLRNIANSIFTSREELFNWSLSHFGNFDITGLLNNKYQTQNKELFKQYFNNTVKNTDINNFATRQRLESRFLRWGARIWSIHNTNEFSPFIFLDEAVIKSTYNIGGEKRQLEEFHYEILKRCDHNLLNIPFYNQQWPELYKIKNKPKQNILNEKRPLRGTSAVLIHSWDSIKSFIVDSLEEKLSDVIDFDKLKRFKANDIQQGHFQPLWQLVGTAAYFNFNYFQNNKFQSNSKIPIMTDEVGDSNLNMKNTLNIQLETKSLTLDKYKIAFSKLLEVNEDLNKIINENSNIKDVYEEIENVDFNISTKELESVKLGVFGSSVTRESFTICKTNNYVKQYFTRISLHSLVSEPSTINIQPIANSTLQKTMVISDIKKNTFDYKNLDVLTIDLIDERFQVLKTDNTFITETKELLESKDIISQLKPILAFKRGSVADINQWIISCKLFKEKLKENQIKIILNKIYYSEVYLTDKNEIKHFNNIKSIKNINLLLKTYYSIFEEIINPSFIINIDKDISIADENHKWGLSPYHFKKEYYIELHHIIEKQLKKIYIKTKHLNK